MGHPVRQTLEQGCGSHAKSSQSQGMGGDSDTLEEGSPRIDQSGRVCPTTLLYRQKFSALEELGLKGLKSEFQIPQDLYYTKEHEWLRIESDKCRIGVTDYAQDSLHEIVYVDLPKVGAKVAQMQSLGTVESVKAVADVYSPISGVVLEVNNALSDAPELVNKTPYGEGWITIMRPDDLKKDLPGLMKAEAYKDLVRKITGKK